MSFLKEINPYMDSILKALTHGSRIDINKIKDINRIYNHLRVEESIEIYGRQKSLNDLPKVDLSCGQCVKSMFEQIIIWYGKKSEPIVEFKGVPQKEIVDDSVQIVSHSHLDLSWGEFKRYCSEQGLRVKGKTKAVLLQELDEIS
jgi:hypothetical protein